MYIDSIYFKNQFLQYSREMSGITQLSSMFLEVSDTEATASRQLLLYCCKYVYSMVIGYSNIVHQVEIVCRYLVAYNPYQW